MVIAADNTTNSIQLENIEYEHMADDSEYITSC